MADEKDIEALKWYVSEGITDVIDDTSQEKMIPTEGVQPSLSRIRANNCKNLEELKNAVSNFEECKIKKTATNTVFADGVSNAPIMLIGEAPGAAEDEQAIPFCGPSGKLLDAMLHSIGISRKKNAYISNCLFWRPPGNRRPTDEEIELCKPFLEKHIALIQPKLLILVGSTAVTSFLGKQYQISKIRREYFEYSNEYLNKPLPVTALFHPAYLLRQPMQKQTTWYDLLYVQDLLQRF